MLHEQRPPGGTVPGLLCIQRGPQSRPDALTCFGAPGTSKPGPHVGNGQCMPTHSAAGRSTEPLEDAWRRPTPSEHNCE